MYIWILLATIMVAFSFYNLSPRQDKDNAFSEIKASSLVSRFKIENAAIVRLFQCDTILRLHTGSWDTNLKYAPNQAFYKIDLNNFHYFDVYNLKPENVMPTGYKPNVVTLDVKNYLYCMDRRLENSEAKIMEECSFGSVVHPTYAISFARIPERWLTKDGTNTPLPAFVKFLADETQFAGVAGYTDCDMTGCDLKGVNARKSELWTHESHYYVDENGNVIESPTVVYEATDYVSIDHNSVIWNNPDFRTECGQNKPCMFMYKIMPTTDERSYCRKLLRDYWQDPNDQNQ